LSADYSDALQNSNDYQSVVHRPSTGNLIAMRKSSNTVRELFPMPQNANNLLMASKSGVLGAMKGSPYQYSEKNRSR